MIAEIHNATQIRRDCRAFVANFLLIRLWRPESPRTKKADVVEHPKAFDHVGLLVSEPSGTAGLLSI